MKNKPIVIILIIILGVCNSILSHEKKSFESDILIDTDYISDNWHFLTTSTPPPPPDNDICSGATEFPIMCGYFENFLSDSEATSDPEATGICLDNTDLGQWYTFTTSDPLESSSLVFGGLVGIGIEIFSTTSDCSNLVFEDCGFVGASFWFEPEPSTQYYLLTAGGQITLSTTNYSFVNATCDAPNSNTNGIWASTDCAMPSSVIPCENDHVIWYEYTTGCGFSDLLIEVIDYSGSQGSTADEISITILLDDCNTLMSDYDVNGLGYVCSAMQGGESISLENLPPETTFLIAFGSSYNESGHFNYLFTETGTFDAAPNDICTDAELLTDGSNINLTNACATSSGLPFDPTLPGCFSQSSATVWYEYDPGSIPQDITITLISTGINTPAIAAYDGCLGTLLGVNCSTLLEIFCIDSPIFIQIGSGNGDEGTFDLELTVTPSQEPIIPLISGNNICSNSEAGITIDIPGGELVNIIVEIAPGSSSSIFGMVNQTHFGVNSITIDDILTNTSLTAQEAIYTISIVSAGVNCPSLLQEFSILVYPGFIVNTISVDECIPYLLELDANEIITGGSSPYITISWYWNSVNLIGNLNLLALDLTESGLITLEIIDSEGCTESTEINVNTSTPIIPTFDFPLKYCRSEQGFIYFTTTSLENIEGQWSIPLIDLSIFTMDGFYDIIFTPNDLSCNLPITLTIEIFSGAVPQFDLPVVLCSEDAEYIFPTEDLNGTPGTWTFASIDLSTNTGLQINTFTPNSVSCFATYEHIFVIESVIEATFGQPESLCRNDAPLTLNNTSNEGLAVGMFQ